MSNSFRRNAVLGVLLIAAGILFLLTNLNLFHAGGWVIGGLFCLGGAYFLSLLAENREKWWAIIPGIVLLDLGGLIILSDLFPAQMSRLGGGFFLGGISLAFWLVYFRVREYWWALIPAGVLLTLAAITIIDIAPFGGMIVPATLFLGIAATFVLVALVGGAGRDLKWAWYPAAVCAVMGSFFLFFSGQAGRLLMPAALIVFGLFLVGKTFLKRNDQ